MIDRDALRARCRDALQAAGLSDVEIAIAMNDATAMDVVMAQMHRDGRTLEDIGAAFGVTRERARQRLRRQGLDRLTGGNAFAAYVGRRDRAKTRATRLAIAKLETWGVDYDTLMEINEGRNLTDSKSRAFRYRQQHKNAKARGVGWELTFRQWVSIWEASGKEHLRGRGAGRYCMARIGDSGPYAIGNVEIVSNAQNVRDGYIVHPAHERQALKVGATQRDELGLTPRMRMVYEAARRCDGNSTRIAEDLGLKPPTVRCMLATLRNMKLLPRPHELLKAAA